MDTSRTLQVVMSVACCLLSVACYQLHNCYVSWMLAHLSCCIYLVHTARTGTPQQSICSGAAQVSRLCSIWTPSPERKQNGGVRVFWGRARERKGEAKQGSEKARRGRGGERKRGDGGRERGASKREMERNSGAIHNVLTGRSRTSTATLSTNLRACACHFGLPKSS